MRRAVALVGAALVALTVLAGCGASTTERATGGRLPDGRLLVVATTTQVADFAAVVGGDRVKVHRIIGPNVDPHDYEPTPADLDAVSRAAVIVRNGIGLDAWLDDVIASASPKGTVVDASTGVAVRRSSDGNEPDPHVWFDPTNVVTIVGTITTALTAADPDRRAAYETDRDAYVAELGRLDTEIEAAIDTLTNKALVTNHDAFGYYVERYGLTFVGSVIPSFDTSADLTPGELDQLVRDIKAQGVKAVFSERSLPAKAAERIAAEAGVKVVSGEDSLYGDTLGPAGSDGATYLQMMRHDTETIVSNLR